MPDHPALGATTRVALAAYLHDIGKLAERAGAFDDDPRLDAHLTLYCPHHPEKGGWFSHRHAAHTALALDRLEPYMPHLLDGDVSPFVGRRRAGDGQAAEDATDSFINAAAAHHRPDTFLQWIIATADRVASGFEREEFDRYNAAPEETATKRNHYQARLLSLFEPLNLKGPEPAVATLKLRHPLLPLTPASMFPVPAAHCEPSANDPARAQYAAVWRWFVESLDRIPASHRASVPLWFDHFDSLWMTATHAVPSATAFNVRPEVSLFDHSRTTAALAAALWRWHEAEGQTDESAARALRERADFQVDKLLLIQGDFFGIQDFIFASGSKTQRQAAKLLRGRSLQVSLFTELAALKVLESLGLPASSQVINAAGKFLIVAPNTAEVRQTLRDLQEELSAWFEQNALGQAGMGLAWQAACCNDLLRGPATTPERDAFSAMLDRLHEGLDEAKHRRFNLHERGAVVFDVAYPMGPCQWNGRMPADDRTDDQPSCALSRDQIAAGEALSRGLDRLVVVDDDGSLVASERVRLLELPLFGYRLAFTAQQEVSGHFGPLVSRGTLRRCWDYALPANDSKGEPAPVFDGYARRFISGYVPRIQAEDVALSDRYREGADDLRKRVGELKSLDLLAAEDRRPDADGRWLGVEALGVLKGDIDDLGLLFERGLARPSFAKWASLSRQVHGFFAIHLPWLLQEEFPSVYTVFAGGDDFFLIGPWRTVQKLAARLREAFRAFVGGNPGIHFSAGIAVQRPGSPITALAALAEDALDEAKSRPGKDAVSCFGQTVAWSSWPSLEASLLLQFIDMQHLATQDVGKGGDPTQAMWRSRLAYRTRRMLLKARGAGDDAALRMLQAELLNDIAVQGIERFGAAYRIPLFNHLYRYRDR